jgi:hypothetical protein
LQAYLPEQPEILELRVRVPVWAQKNQEEEEEEEEEAKNWAAAGDEPAASTDTVKQLTIKPLTVLSPE